jgi:hypothetical protein
VSRKTKIPGIPNPPVGTSAPLRNTLTQIKEALEVLLGRRGAKLDRAVTFRDLTDDIEFTQTIIGGGGSSGTQGPTGPQGPQGPQGLTGSVSHRWIDYAAGATSQVLTVTIATGDVYTYTYGTDTLYRLVPSGSEPDAFYSVFADGVLSALVATKRITI